MVTFILVTEAQSAQKIEMPLMTPGEVLEYLILRESGCLPLFGNIFLVKWNSTAAFGVFNQIINFVCFT